MSVFEAAIGWLAPPLCVGCGGEGASLCAECSPAKILPFGERCAFCGTVSKASRSCQNCRRGGVPSHVWVTTNHEGLARDLLHNYKFGQQRAAADSIAHLMTTTLNQLHPDVRGLTSHKYLVVPVPTATKRVRERGFDHSALLAKKIANQLKLDYRPALGRLGQTRQVGAKRADRLTQMDGKFWVKRPAAVRGWQILLTDDVITTGATLRAAAKVLRQAGALRVDALIFAKRL